MSLRHPAAAALSALLISAPTAAADTVPARAAGTQSWSEGRTASYVVQGDHGIRYQVRAKVPDGVKFKLRTWETGEFGRPIRQTFRVVSNDGSCHESWDADANLNGSTFKKALKSPPERWGTWVDGGSGAGKVRWSAFERHRRTDPTDPLMVYMALDPRLTNVDEMGRHFYGFQITDRCMSSEDAQRVAETVRITPLPMRY